MANERESKRWNHELWVGEWPKRERLTEALTPYVLAAADPGAHSGGRVCDIGCGGGALTVALAGALGSTGQVVGIDFSQPLVELARERASQAGVGTPRSSSATCRPRVSAPSLSTSPSASWA